jgi:uncharacterized protein (TIGR02246 family)
MNPPAGARAALMASPDDTEAQFYEALQTGDIDRLMAVWADDDEVVCVHPGGARIIGLAAIRASFDAIFAQNPVPVQPEQVHRLHTLNCAVHHLAERVSVLTPQGPQTAWALATNVYVKTPVGWRLVAHHASPGQLGDPPPTLREPPSTLH